MSLPELPRAEQAQQELILYTDRRKKTRTKRGRGAINVLYGEALNRKPRKSTKSTKSRKPRKPRMVKGITYSAPIGPTIPSYMIKKISKKGKVYYKRKRGQYYETAIGPQLPAGAVAYKKRGGQTGYKVRKVSKKTGKSYWKYF